MANFYVSRQFNLKFKTNGQTKMLLTDVGLAMTLFLKIKMLVKVMKQNLKPNAWLSTILQTLIQE